MSQAKCVDDLIRVRWMVMEMMIEMIEMSAMTKRCPVSTDNLKRALVDVTKSVRCDACSEQC